MDNARFLAIKLLNKTFDKQGFSNLVLDYALSNAQLEPQDKRFCSMLYYGVIERKITLDYIISKYSKKPLNKLDLSILNILRCGIYQLKYMDSVPDSAAINESVKLVKKYRLTSAAGFVNAVLRNFVRDNKEFSLPKEKIARFSLEYSAPEWLVKKLLEEYDEESAISVLESSVLKAPVTIRLNNIIADEEKLIENMGGIELKKSELIENCYEALSGDVTATDAFKKGYFHVQDISSQLCCMALGVKENEIVLDLCSAPGGKAFTIAELMNGTGTVYAFDMYENRVQLIKDGTERLYVKNIKAMSRNALEFDKNIPLADKILCDVPCSGLGVIRKKPEIKYKNPKEFEGLTDIQYGILENAVKYLKVGGELVYSTCTLNRKENDDIIDRFLAKNNDYEGVSFLEDYGEPFGSYKATIIPMHFNSDGFFISKIKKIR